MQWTLARFFQKIRQHYSKERFKISKIAKCESASHSREILQSFVWWGAETCPLPYKRL